MGSLLSAGDNAVGSGVDGLTLASGGLISTSLLLICDGSEGTGTKGPG